MERNLKTARNIPCSLVSPGLGNANDSCGNKTGQMGKRLAMLCSGVRTSNTFVNSMHENKVWSAQPVKAKEDVRMES